MLTALDVGVSKFVNNNDCRFTCENRVHVHLFENRALVFHFAQRDSFELGSEFRSCFASVTLDHTDGDVFTAAGTTDRLAEHAVGLADSRSISQEKLERALRFLWSHFAQPVVRR